jgi:hypothetical protein
MLCNFKGLVTTRHCRCLLVYLTLTRKEKHRSRLVASYCLVEVRETHYWRLERERERERERASLAMSRIQNGEMHLPHQKKTKMDVYHIPV